MAFFQGQNNKLNLLIHKNSKASMRDLGEWIDLKDSDTTFMRVVQVMLSEWRQDDGVIPEDQERS